MKVSAALSLANAILVVEDSDEDFDTLCEVAQAAGLSRPIHRAASGGDCLALLQGEGQATPSALPALILMDLNSHGVDGREALVAIKAASLLKGIPVVILTTSASRKDLALCYQAGANACHVKPVRHDAYRRLLATMLSYWLECATLQTAVPKVA